MHEPSIRLQDVDLFYPSSALRTFSIKEYAFNLARLRPNKPLIHDVHALKAVTLDIAEGQRLGVIGPNGAGKSTLLKTIAQIYPIQAGAIRVTGRVHSLFDLSLGFEFEATGRENIVYRGLLMGEKPAVIRSKADEIIAFADLGEFIDYPVKTYSAGMLVRLAFSICTSFPGKILLLDEVVGAGDASFSQKARKRIDSLISKAQILILVSHDLTAIQTLCNRAIRMDRGEVIEDGPPAAVVEGYLGNIHASPEL